MTAETDEQSCHPIGHLEVFDSFQQTSENVLPVYRRSEFDVGRSTIKEMLNVVENSISSHHVRFRCVVYEDDESHSVLPMVYMQVLSSNGVIYTRAGSDAIPVAIHSGDPDVLLSDRDQVKLTRRITLSYYTTASESSRPPQHNAIRRAELKHIEARYVVTNRVLGIGGYASVHLAVKRGSERQLACKILSVTLSHSDPLRPQAAKLALRKKRENLAREYNVLKDLSHPNIVSLEKVFCTPRNIYIFQELITGGDLLSYLDRAGPLPEAHAAMIVRQLLEAVEYLHRNNVVHRDIKPENVLMTSWRVGARVILTDFGQSRRIDDVHDDRNSGNVFRMQSLVGTHGYTAPEVYLQMKHKLDHVGGYSKAVDMWSVGTIVSTLLTQDFLIPGEDMLDCSQSNLSQYKKYLDVLDNGAEWQSFSAAVKSFIRGCLAIDENIRITAQQGLAHEWFTRKCYRAEFDAAYNRAIQSWRPRELDDELVEVLKIDHLHKPAEVNSHHFAAKSAQQPLPRVDALVTSTPNHLPGSSHAGWSPRKRQSTAQASKLPVKSSTLTERMASPEPSGRGDRSSIRKQLRFSQMTTQSVPDISYPRVNFDEMILR